MVRKPAPADGAVAEMVVIVFPRHSLAEMVVVVLSLCSLTEMVVVVLPLCSLTEMALHPMIEMVVMKLPRLRARPEHKHGRDRDR
jgi:hypothetical protein